MLRSSASSAGPPDPAWARAKICAAGSRRRSSSACARVGDAREPLGPRLDERPDERAVLVESGPPGEACSSNANGRSAPSSSSRAQSANPPSTNRRSER